MKLSFGFLVITAGIFGILSFAFLAAAIGSDYWYIIKVNRTNQTNTEVLGSQNEGQKVYSFTFNSSSYSEPEMHMLNMHSASVVFPPSLVLLLFVDICGLISSLTRSPALLTGTVSNLFFCSVLTLSGVSLYTSYSQQALAETESVWPRWSAPHSSWSLGLALLLPGGPHWPAAGCPPRHPPERLTGHGWPSMS
ncbi:transmembrane protein 235-like [Salvelinus alpinus]|uniref:transmembrane protein 235-like n=1 Tax=Salvelinus alpinus TaxID=8036 RepID=UPI0039FCE586